MKRRSMWCIWLIAGLVALQPVAVAAQGFQEITPKSEAALERGLEWLARNQTPEGNWKSRELGLVAMGALAFLAAGYPPRDGEVYHNDLPKHVRYGIVVRRALEYIMENAKSNGLLNMATSQHDMYNHGLATFVLGQAYGMSNDRKISQQLDRALKLISNTQCLDGGWDYHASRKSRGHDLSLVVMQAKALRSAVDSGLEVPPEVVELAIRCVREHYRADNGKSGDDAGVRSGPGQFTYHKGGGHKTVALAAAGVVCLQEFGQYDDWRIPKNIAVIRQEVDKLNTGNRDGKVPFDGYTLYYVGQAIYQVGGSTWEHCYPRLRDHLIATQVLEPNNPSRHGAWRDGKRVGGSDGDLYGTAVGCFVLAIPNRYLPILQRAKLPEEVAAASEE